MQIPLREGLALPWPADACVPILIFQDAPPNPASFPQKNGVSRKDAHPL